jgi:hypothetical protein
MSSLSCLAKCAWREIFNPTSASLREIFFNLASLREAYGIEKE